MDYLLCGLLILGLVAIFGTLTSAFVYAVLNWCGVDIRRGQEILAAQ